MRIIAKGASLYFAMKLMVMVNNHSEYILTQMLIGALVCASVIIKIEEKDKI